MGKKMDMHDLARVNQLWAKVYPYLADQISDYYTEIEGDVLEWGPFSGGISFALQNKKSALKITVAVEEEDVYALMHKTLTETGHAGQIRLEKSPLVPLRYDDHAFDLVVLRGAYFFLDREGKALREIYRVIKPDGVGFIGGGYGKNIPQSVIKEIAEESRILNDSLGRVRVTVEDLRAMIGKAGLEDDVRIIMDGGLWLLLEK